jgi:hypothetical protein
MALSGGTVALDTRFGDTYRFGFKLSEPEAVALAKKLKAVFSPRQPTGAWSGLAGGSLYS